MTFEFDDELINELELSLESALQFKKKDRFYVIYKIEDGKLRGQFLFQAKRKRAPWAGYSDILDDTIDMEDF